MPCCARRSNKRCEASPGEGPPGTRQKIGSHAAIGRYKAIIGPKLRARILPAQQGEAAIATEVLNHMIRVAKPASIRAA